MRRTLFSMVQLTAVLFATSIAASGARAALLAVNVDVNDGNSSTYSGPGAAPAPGTFWNGVATPFPSGTLTESDGLTNSGLTFSVTNFTNTYSNAGQPAFAPALFGDFVYTVANTPGTAANFSINNVPTGYYDLYLYSLNGNGGNSTSFGNNAKTAFVVNGVTQTVQNPNANASDPSFHGFVLGGNYTLYSHLIVPTAGGTITGTFYDAAASASSFNGFQLVQVTPEPSSVILSGIGFVGIIVVARRRKTAVAR